MPASSSASPACIKKHFRNLKDPRVQGRIKHRLIDIVVITICAIISDCDDWEAIHIFAQERKSWFARFLKLTNGIPCVDTFQRVFQKLNPQAFQRCCVDWLKHAADLVGMADDKLEHIAIDGKTSRGSGGIDFRPLHLVSAWATKANLFLGQVAVDEKSNEITAIPRLLELLCQKGALITIDAMGCQKEIAAKIIEMGADYILPVKENQERLLEDVEKIVDKAMQGELDASKVRTVHTQNEGHGRTERRTYMTIYDVTSIRDLKLWSGLKVVGVCFHHRTVKGKETSEVHYFIGSRKMGVTKYAEALRGHWGIENNLHWQLDVSFGEDANKVADRNAAENLSIMRKVALGLVKQIPGKESIANKRRKAALNPGYLQEIITGANNLVNF